MPDDRLPTSQGRLEAKPDVKVQGTSHLQITISWKVALPLAVSVAGMIWLFSEHVDGRFTEIDGRLDALESSLQRIIGAITGQPAN